MSSLSATSLFERSADSNLLLRESRGQEPYGSIQGRPVELLQINYKQLQCEKCCLESLACCRKTGLKIAALLCLPLNIFAFFWFDDAGPCSRLPYYVDDATGFPISRATTCVSCCWRPAIPPENSGDLYCLICNPFVLCFCCAEETTDNYLVPHERQRMHEITQQIAATVPDGSNIVDEVRVNLPVAVVNNVLTSYMGDGTYEEEKHKCVVPLVVDMPFG